MCGDERERRRRHAFDPAGLTQSGWPNRRRTWLSFHLKVRRATAKSRSSWDRQRLAAPMPGDILLLPIRDKPHIWRQPRGAGPSRDQFRRGLAIHAPAQPTACLAALRDRMPTAELRPDLQLCRLRPSGLGVAIAVCKRARALFNRSISDRCRPARIDPTQPSAIPLSVNRSSALSARRERRYSARDVNMR